MELCVVGAGFAGLACARAAAARGLRVRVLERKPDPGAACRTTGLLVQEAAEELEPPARLVRRIPGVRLYAPSLRVLDLESPGYWFLATDTPALLRRMAEGIDIVRGEYRGGFPFGARFLVGADGPRSRVAREFGLGVNLEFLVGVEAEFEGVRGVDDSRLHCFLDSRLAPGYIGWVVPGLGVTQVGLACRAPGRPRLGRFVEKISAIFDFDRARVVGRRGGLIPVGGPVRPYAAERVLLIGDAAGLVSPLTAGGIHTAVASGRRAGEAVAAHLRDGGPHPARTPPPRFFWKRLLRRIFDLGPPNPLLDAALASPLPATLARAVFFHHRGLFSRDAWRDLVLSLQ